jgi:hypothetical protein
MKWFNKWFAKKTKQAWDEAKKEAMYGSSISNIQLIKDDSSRSRVNVDGMNFTVMTAEGGIIVQMRTYDSRTDKGTVRTYVIPEGDPIAERIGHIVSMEFLRS